MTITANFTNGGGAAIGLESYTADTGETFSGAETADMEVATGDFLYPEASAEGYGVMDDAPNETAFSVTISQRTGATGTGPRNGVCICHDGGALGAETCYRIYVNGAGEFWFERLDAGVSTDLGSQGLAGVTYDETALQDITIERTAGDHIIVSYAGVQQIDADESSSPLANGQIATYLRHDAGASQEVDSLTSNATTGGGGGGSAFTAMWRRRRAA